MSRIDMYVLLQSHPETVISMGWSLKKPIKDWEGVEVKDGRIFSLCFIGSYMGPQQARKLMLPSGLRILNLNSSYICNDGLKGLVLPHGLQHLSLSNNNITDYGAKGLVLPPTFSNLDIGNYEITSLKMVLPPSLQKIRVFNTGITKEKLNLESLPTSLSIRTTNRTIRGKNNDKSNETYSPSKSERRYLRIKLFYNKTVQKEIYRGLLYGETTDPIFTFLKTIYGSSNIRRLILELFEGLLLQKEEEKYFF